MLQDLRIAVRALRRNPVFSLTAIAVLALGIGANSAIFGLVDQALLSPPGISSPARVVAVRAKYLKLNLPDIPISGPDFRDVREARDTFEHTAVMEQSDLAYWTSGTPRVLRGAKVSREWFDVFGATPELGRTFAEEEDQPAGQPAVVLSHAAWLRLFGGDPLIVGKTMTIDDKPARVVGVMRADFRWPREVDAWVSLGLQAAEFTDEFRFNEHLVGVARLGSDASVAGANARIGALAGRVRNGSGESADFAKSSQSGMFAVPFTDYVAGDSKRATLVLVGGCGFVLLIACANIAALMLSRATSRSREIAVRAAIGAGRWRLIRQTVIEKRGVGGRRSRARPGVGVRRDAPDAGRGAGRFGRRPAAPDRRHGAAVHSRDWRRVGAALRAGPGVAGDSRRSGGSPQGRRAPAGGNRRRQRLRAGLVVAETALAMVLLVGAGLPSTGSLGQVQGVAPGFEPRGLVIGGVALPQQQYQRPEERVLVPTGPWSIA